MATTAFIPANNSKYYLSADAGPSPPESYANGQSMYGAPMSHTPPSNNSPTNVTSGVKVRQLRQPRQPMYIPAALRPTGSNARPTDIPSRPQPLDTPPASKDSSFDSGKIHSPLSDDQAGTPAVRLDSVTDFEALRRGLIRVESETLDEELGDVTGGPTTAHWKPDVSANACYICNATFTWFFRRHHCRRCGQLVCDADIKNLVPLDQNARFHPQGTPSKACRKCLEDWKIVKKFRHSRTSSLAESSNSSQGTAMPIPTVARQSDELRVGSLARSEGGMVWSTF